MRQIIFIPLAAICSISSLYLNNIFDSNSLSWIMISLTFIFLICAVDFNHNSNIYFQRTSTDRAHKISLMFFFSFLLLAALSTASGAFSKAFEIADLGQLSLVTLLPLVLMLTDNDRFIKHVSALAVFFALADSVVNILSWGGFLTLTNYSGRVDDNGFTLRQTGVSGNTHASGLVAFIALTYLAIKIFHIKSQRSLILFVLTFLLILFSLYLLDARRYQVMIIFVIISIIINKITGKNPLLILTATLSTLMLTLTFRASDLDYGNILRGRLIQDAFYKAFDTPVIGSGLRWSNPLDLQGTYESLSAGGVTESYALKMCASFGILGTVLFLLSVVISINMQKLNLSAPSLLLAMLTAELAFGGSLLGILGASVFFSCLFSRIYLDGSENLQKITSGHNIT